MKRKTFLKSSSLFVAGSMIAPFGCNPEKKPIAESSRETLKNWAGNYTYKAEHFHEPTTVEELQALVKELGSQKALGSRHCFNNIADSPKHQISTRKLDKMLSLDEENKTVTVEAGARYGDFAETLDAKGYALHNLASLPHITVAGACSTGTHGSGMELGNLPSAVVAIELVTPSGNIVHIDRAHPDFHGVIVGLGAFGIITKVTLEVQDTYEVRQDLFQELPLESLEAHFEEIMSAGYSVSLFTNWLDKKVSQIWVKRRTDQETPDLGSEYFGARAASRNLHPIVELSSENCTDQMGVPGPWYNRIPHFKMGFMPSGGKELQAEYFVPKENAVDAILALEKKKDLIYPQLMISEIRAIAADEYWMSPCYQQDSIAIHFTWKQNPVEVGKLLPMIESELAPFGVRPHWGKLFSIAPQTLHERYEKFDDFLALAKKYDPEGKFRNAYLDLNLYG